MGLQDRKEVVEALRRQEGQCRCRKVQSTMGAFQADTDAHVQKHNQCNQKLD